MDVLIVFNAISCRRTGVPLNIKARKDSHGFENINDYFPDSGEIIVIIVTIIILFVTVNVLMYSNDLFTKFMSTMAPFHNVMHYEQFFVFFVYTKNHHH